MLYIKLITFGILISLSPLLALQMCRLWQIPHFQFFPIMLFGVGYLLYRERHDLPPENNTVVGARTLIFASALGAILVAVAALVLVSPLLAHIAFIILSPTLCFSILGTQPNSRSIATCSSLFICVPLPFGMDGILVSSLQSLSSRVCAVVLDAFHIPNVCFGNTIQLVSKHLFVEEACSGVDSIYSLAAVAIFMLLFARAGLIASVVTLLSVPVWATMGNMIRILIIAFFLDLFACDLSSGFQHQFLGALVFFVVSACHLATAHSIKHVFLPPVLNRSAGHISKRNILSGRELTIKSAFPGEDPLIGASKNASSRRNFSDLYSILATVGVIAPLLTGMGLCLFVIVRDDAFRTHSAVLKDIDPRKLFEEKSFASIFGSKGPVNYEFTKRDRLSSFGAFSHTWIARSGVDSQVLSIDFPFYDGHALEVCYVGLGWEIVATDHKDVSFGSHPPFTVTTLKMRRGDEFAAVMYTHFDESGVPVQPSSTKQLVRRLTLFELLTADRKFFSNKTVFQVQLVLFNNQSDSTQEKKRMSLFMDIVEASFNSIVSKEGL
ncbi:exosortase U [Pirellulaceae bacterium SH501]